MWTSLILSGVAVLGAGDSMRYTETVESLTRLPPERRAALAQNPEGRAPAELTASVSEINQIELDNSISDAVATRRLKVIAWNIERGREWEGAVQLIRAEKALEAPDIILLSEMDLGMARSGNEHTTRKMAEALGMNYAYGVEFLELSLGKAADLETTTADANTWGYHGNAILSRFPLSDVRMLRFPGIEKWYGSGEHRLGGRMALFATIQSQGETITLVSTHLESGMADTEARAREVRLILAELDAHVPEAPVILGGDLNAFHKHEPVELLRAAGFNVDEANDLEIPTSQRVKDGRVLLGGAHIDYVMARGLPVYQDWAQVVMAAYPPGPEGKLLSDHAAVVAIFEVVE